MQLPALMAEDNLVSSMQGKEACPRVGWSRPEFCNEFRLCFFEPWGRDISPIGGRGGLPNTPEENLLGYIKAVILRELKISDAPVG
jgi:hypothetical protein